MTDMRPCIHVIDRGRDVEFFVHSGFAFNTRRKTAALSPW
jgi:hypothetical protein